MTKVDSTPLGSDRIISRAGLWNSKVSVILKQICSICLSGCLDNPFLLLTLTTDHCGREVFWNSLSCAEWACSKPHTKGVSFCQTLIFRDAYFPFLQFSYLTASSRSVVSRARAGRGHQMSLSSQPFDPLQKTLNKMVWHPASPTKSHQ